MAKNKTRMMAPSRNKMLSRMIKEVEKTVPPAAKEEYLSTVMVSKRILFDDSTSDDALAALENVVTVGDIPDAVTQVVVEVIAQVHGQSGGKITSPVMISASVPIAASVLQYIQVQGDQKIPKAVIEQTMKSVIVNMMHLLGLDGETVDRLATGNYQMRPETSAEVSEGVTLAEEMEAGAPTAPVPLMAAGGQVYWHSVEG